MENNLKNLQKFLLRQAGDNDQTFYIVHILVAFQNYLANLRNKTNTIWKEEKIAERDKFPPPQSIPKKQFVKEKNQI